jgi:hypothetical protein
VVTIDELRDEYAGRVRMVVLPAADPSAEHYDFGPTRHGLVALSADGELVSVLPGHDFGRAEFVAQVEDLLRRAR